VVFAQEACPSTVVDMTSTIRLSEVEGLALLFLLTLLATHFAGPPIALNICIDM
jgi:hypothetical protein